MDHAQEIYEFVELVPSLTVKFWYAPCEKLLCVVSHELAALSFLPLRLVMCLLINSQLFSDSCQTSSEYRLVGGPFDLTDAHFLVLPPFNPESIEPVLVVDLIHTGLRFLESVVDELN